MLKFRVPDFGNPDSLEFFEVTERERKWLSTGTFGGPLLDIAVQ